MKIISPLDRCISAKIGTAADAVDYIVRVVRKMAEDGCILSKYIQNIEFNDNNNKNNNNNSSSNNNTNNNDKSEDGELEEQEGMNRFECFPFDIEF